jgi:hypothetical protein
MDLDAAVSDEWVKYGTPPRKRKPSDEPGTPYSPAFPVKLPNTPQAKKIAAEETKEGGESGTREEERNGWHSSPEEAEAEEDEEGGTQDSSAVKRIGLVPFFFSRIPK